MVDPRDESPPPRERPWPLSAAASLVLLDPRSTTARDVLLLTLKELVGRGAWRVRKQDKRSLLRSRTTVLLRPGPLPDRPLPRPLDVLESWIRPLPLDAAGELPLPVLAKKLREARGDRWATTLLERTRERLEREGHLSVRRRLVLGERWERTVSGEAWAREIATQTRALREDLPRLVATDRATAAELLSRVGWLLLLVPEAAEHLPALRDWRERQLEQRREGESVAYTGEPGGGGVWPLGGGDHAPWDLDGLDGVFDGAFDAAVSGGDFGGGGGGDGDGGDGGGD